MKGKLVDSAAWLGLREVVKSATGQVKEVLYIFLSSLKKRKLTQEAYFTDKPQAYLICIKIKKS